MVFQDMKKLLIATGIVLAMLWLIKQPDMTWRQSLMKIFYPIIRKGAALTGDNSLIKENAKQAKPVASFHSLNATSIKGETIPLETFKGKKVLLVNTASDCGYTGQLSGLEELHQAYKDKLAIIGFPANDFKNQEKGSNEEIEKFCSINYGVTFLLTQKTTVVKGPGQHPVFSWLSNASKNGWNETAPGWNFSKYLVDENGMLLAYFGPAVAPKEVEKYLR